ncbi:MAG: hypothetical protein AB7O97_24500 [Planctomycetota bacterium]
MSGLSRWGLGVLWFVVVHGGLCAQRTWIVDKYGRGGEDFDNLPAALAAAAPGDTIFLRATGPDPLLDGYGTGAATVNEGLRILGEDGGPPVVVHGSWTVSNLLSDDQLIFSNVLLRGDPFSDLFFLDCTACAGAITLDRVTVTAHSPLVSGMAYTSVRPSTRFVDCDLVTFSHCTIDTVDTSWQFVRSRGMIDDTTMEQSLSYAGLVGNQLWLGALRAEDSELWISGSTITGPSPTTSLSGAGHSSGPAVYLCRSTVHVGGGSAITGGTSYFGTQYAPFGNVSCWRNPADWPHIYHDSSVLLRHGLAGNIVYHAGPQAAVRYTQTATTLTIAHHFDQQPGATLLLIGQHQLPAWSDVIGPVFLDGLTAWSDLRLAPQTGPVTHTFAIPPGIPPGTLLAVQAFNWLQPDTFLTSNVTTVGFW